MALKRKRSSAAMASPFSDCSETSAMTQQSTASAIPNFYQLTKPIEPWNEKPTWSFPTYEDEPTQLVNSRTRKRHRDNRPDEQAVYESTMMKLYTAQRTLPVVTAPIPSHQSTSTIPTTAITQHPQRSTLHAFWHIPHQLPTSTAMALDSGPPSHVSPEAAQTCTDCDRYLQSLPGDTMDMDLDNGFVEQEARCINCGFLVCDGCAVLGDHRVCLMCATHGGR